MNNETRRVLTVDSSKKSTSRVIPAPCIREKLSADLADKAESSILLDHYQRKSAQSVDKFFIIAVGADLCVSHHAI
jgi:hypothetical protein